MKLKTCPDSPNCVSSQSCKPSQLINPLPFESSVKEAMDQLKQLILTMPCTNLVDETEDYLHIEFSSRFLKFVDDLEILIDADEKLIHFRSASRVGYWDFGVNQRRIEGIKKQFLVTLIQTE